MRTLVEFGACCPGDWRIRSLDRRIKEDDVDIASRPWRYEICSKLGLSAKAAIVSESSEPGRIVACNAAWNSLCGFTPDEALGETPKILQGKGTSVTKAKRYAAEVLSKPYLRDDAGFASRQDTTRAKLVNYTKTGRPFVHCLTTRRVKDEDTGEEYFVTESHEEKEQAICRAMLVGEEQPSGSKVRDTDGAIFVLGVSVLVYLAVRPVLQAIGSLVLT